uniref:Uncharacterized protein n=1 Tax=Rhizophora mucronata TaxID=61149 RepID=A0A2P2QFG2_RHIMU
MGIWKKMNSAETLSFGSFCFPPCLRFK